MSIFSKAYRIVSFLLAVFVLTVFCPLTAVVAANTYQTAYIGTESISSMASSDCTYEYNKDGFAGKLLEDKVYYYSSSTANTGKGYFSMGTSEKDDTHDADSTVIEFSFLLEDESSEFHFSPAFYNDTGYEYFLENGKLVTTSGKGYFKSLNDFIQFSSQGVYISDSSSEYVDSNFRGVYLDKNKPLEVGVWHTVAIRTPGLINSKGGATYDEENNVVEGVYAGESIIYVYVDGTEYTIPLTKQIYGTRHIKMHGTGKMYLDNLMMYMTNQLDNPSDYKNAVKPPVLQTENDTIDITDNAINFTESITVSQLKAALNGADAVRVYADSTYKTLMEDSETVKSGNMVVAAAKNGCDMERSYAYYRCSEIKSMVFASDITITNGEGTVITGSADDVENLGETYYLNTTITNKTKSLQAVNAILASYTNGGRMDFYESKQIEAKPGTTEFSTVDNPIEFKNVTVPSGGTLKAFLLIPSTLEPVGKSKDITFSGVEEYHVLAFGNSYSANSMTYLSTIAAAAGVNIYAVNMNTGSCSLEKHYNYMKGTGTYTNRVEYFPDGNKIITNNVSFADGLNTKGYKWDYITMHQRGQLSGFFDTFYTEENPYITELADYIRENSPSSEVLFFENWPVYTDRIIEKYDSVYKPIVQGCKVEEYVPTLFASIKSSYLNAAEKIGNPGRVIPAGEAVYLAITKYGFAEYVDNNDKNDTYFTTGARAMFRDTSSHMTNPYGCVLIGLTWYEYLTGHDVRDNPYTHEDIPAADMELLKKIAHEACSISDYKKK